MEEKIKEYLIDNFYKKVKKIDNFYTFEGIDGSGKTTTIEKVIDILNSKGINKIFVTSEPNCKDLSFCKEITNIIYKYKEELEDIKETEAFLFAATRNFHVNKVILPKIEKGFIVLCDRYIDSSFCYQGLTNDNIINIAKINKVAINGIMPKYTFFFDINVEDSYIRLLNRTFLKKNSFDRLSKKKYEIIANNYRKMSDLFSERYIKVDTKQDINLIAANISNFIIKNNHL